MTAVVVAGDALPFDAEQRQKLARALDELITPALAAHDETARLTELDWKWYNAIPHTPERTRPFRNASNVVYPLIATHADSIHARRFLSIFANGEIWATKTQNEEWRVAAAEYVRFLNHEADDNAFDLMTPGSDAFHAATVTGRGVLGLQWGRRVRHRFLPGSKVPRAVQLHNGIHVLNIPGEQICWEPGKPLAESEYVIRQALRMSLADLVRAATPVDEGGAGWNREEVAKLIQERPEATYTMAYQAPDDLFSLRDTPFAPVNIYEIWAEWPLMKGLRVPGPDEDAFAHRPAIVIYYHRDSRRILHVMAHPYPIQGWPFYEFGFSPQRGKQRGVAKLLSHLQATISTSFNQANDVVAWASRILGLTNDKDLVGKTFGDGLEYTAMDVSSTRFDLKPTPYIAPNLQIIQLALAAAERLTGQSDPNFGRESRSGGHPAPATSTVALLKQGQTVLSRVISFDRKEISRFGEDATALYQHFEAAQNGNRIERVIGAGDAKKLTQVLFPAEPIAGLLEMDVRAASEGQDAQSLFQQAVQVDQVLTNYYAKITQGLNVAMQALMAPPMFQGPILQVAFHSMMGITESTNRILSAANVDDYETFTELLRDAISGPTAAALQQVQLAAAAGLQAAGGASPGAAVATGPNGLPAGASNAPAQPPR